MNSGIDIGLINALKDYASFLYDAARNFYPIYFATGNEGVAASLRGIFKDSRWEISRDNFNKEAFHIAELVKKREVNDIGEAIGVLRDIKEADPQVLVNTIPPEIEALLEDNEKHLLEKQKAQPAKTEQRKPLVKKPLDEQQEKIIEKRKEAQAQKQQAEVQKEATAKEKFPEEQAKKTNTSPVQARQYSVAEEVKNNKILIKESLDKSDTAQQFLENKVVYVRTRIPKKPQLTENQKKVIDSLKLTSKAQPQQLTEQIASEINSKIQTPLVAQGLSVQEVEILSKQTALKIVKNLNDLDSPAKIADSTKIAVLSAVNKNTTVIGDVAKNKIAQEVVKKASSNIANVEGISDEVSRKITENVLGKDFADTVFGPNPAEIEVTISPTPQDSFDQKVDLGQLNQGGIQLLNNQDYALDQISSLGQDGAKSFFFARAGTVVEKAIAEVPAESFLGGVIASPEAKSLLFTTFGVGESVSWEATNWVGGLVLRFSPESAPVLSAFGRVIGVDFLTPTIVPTIAVTAEAAGETAALTTGIATAGEVATTAATTAATEVAATTAGVTGAEVGAEAGAAVGAAGGPLAIVTAAIGAVVGFISSKLLIKISDFIKKNKDFFLATLGAPAVIAGGAIGSTAIVITGAAFSSFFVARMLGINKFSLRRLARRTILKAPDTAVKITLAMLITFFSFALFVIVILFFINSGAFVVPPDEATITGSGTATNPYIDIKKEVDARQFKNPPVQVTYTVTISAKRGDLTNISFENVCQVMREGSEGNCPAEVPEAPESISTTTPFVYTYSETYSGNSYQDSLVLDTFSITADAPGVSATQTSASASVIIGNPPTQCFVPDGDWPSDFLVNLTAAIEYMTSNYSILATKVCSGGTILLRYNSSSNATYWGWYHGSWIEFYSLGLDTEPHARYILFHESGHALADRIPSLYMNFLSWGGIANEVPRCFYNYDPNSYDERFAEGVSFYANDPCGNFQTQTPHIYEFMRDVVYQ